MVSLPAGLLTTSPVYLNTELAMELPEVCSKLCYAESYFGRLAGNRKLVDGSLEQMLYLVSSCEFFDPYLEL